MTELRGIAQLNYTTDELNEMLPSLEFVGKPDNFEIRDEDNPYLKYELVTRNGKAYSLMNQDTFYGPWVDSAWEVTDIFIELDKMRAVYVINDLIEKVGQGPLLTTSQNLTGAVNEIVTLQGNLSQLKTVHKSTLVGAINETYDAIPSITTENEILVIH